MVRKTSRAAAEIRGRRRTRGRSPAQQGSGEVHPRPRQVDQPQALAGLRGDQPLAQRHFLAEARLRLRKVAAIEVERAPAGP